MCARALYGPELLMVYASALGHVRAFQGLRMHGRANGVRRSAQDSWGPSVNIALAQGPTQGVYKCTRACRGLGKR